MIRLPEEWCLAPVRDLIELGPKNECPDELEVGFVPLARLGVRYRSRHTFEIRTWGEVKRGYTQFADGDVLLAKITPSFENGKAGVVQGLPNGIGAGSTEYFVCRPHLDVILPRYLLACFKSRKFIESGRQLMSGAVGHKRVPKQYLLDAEIPLPPLEEQRRIIDRLDWAFERVDRCRQHHDRVRAKLRRLRQSVLAHATSGDLTQEWRMTSARRSSARDLLGSIREGHLAFAEDRNEAPSGRGRGRRRRYPIPAPVDPPDMVDIPDSWVWVSGAEVVEPGHEIVYGIVQPGPRVDGGIPYVRGTDIQDGAILIEQLFRTSPEISARHARSSLRGGDVLLGIIRATKVAIVPDQLDGANITQGTARFRPSAFVLPEYLAIALEAPATQAWLHARYRGIDMPGLNLADVRRVPIPLPPVDEQAEVVRLVDALLAAGNRVSDLCDRSGCIVDVLAKSVLGKALRGEIVPQDADDEPASETLARSLATRDRKPATQKASPTTRKPKMPSITPESLREAVNGLPAGRFSFDDLRAFVSGDYESLKDVLLVLLGSEDPPLRQVFDDELQTMLFERTV